VEHAVGQPVKTLELERLPDGRQRLSIGVDQGHGRELVLHLFGEMTLVSAVDNIDNPLGYELLFTPALSAGFLGEIRISIPKAE
jgi:hypothetical protein